MVFHEVNNTRRVPYLSESPASVHFPLIRNGDAIGKWDGDTLVVDTIGFNDKSWLMSGMEPHTEEAHMIERMRTVKDGAYFEIVTVVEDRHALTSAYTSRPLQEARTRSLKTSAATPSISGRIGATRR